MTVFTSYAGNNADLVAEVAKLYLGDEPLAIADVTYGKGVFWRKVDLSKHDFRPTDLQPHPKADRKVKKADLRKLPYKNETLDILVLDPPYVHNPGQLLVDANYQNAETTKGMYHDDIVDLYVDGIKEAWRTLKEGGTLWVKCKDEVESGWQRWSMIELYCAAVDLGFYAKDLFILVPHSKPTIQKPQQHARKNHSYLWIFLKPDPKLAKRLVACGKRYRYGIWPGQEKQAGT